METGDHFERVFHVVDQILKKKKKKNVGSFFCADKLLWVWVGVRVSVRVRVYNSVVWGSF